MRRVGLLLGVAVALVGILIALFPFISVWQVSGQVLDELPLIPAAEAEDDRHRFAVFDSDFVLATRTYKSIALTDAEVALASHGFEYTRAGGERWLSKECCGEYDAVWVQLEETGSGSVKATITAADADVQSAWAFFPAMGLALVLAGSIGASTAAKHTSPKSVPEPVDQPSRT